MINSPRLSELCKFWVICCLNYTGGSVHGDNPISTTRMRSTLNPDLEAGLLSVISRAQAVDRGLAICRWTFLRFAPK